jgi:hypothetical protein
MEDNILILFMFDDFNKVQDFVEIDTAVFSQKIMSLSRDELKRVVLELEYRIGLLVEANNAEAAYEYRIKLGLVSEILDTK